MAKKRDKSRESIFVTNEYFEKCGISRQVVRFGIEKEKIKPAGNLIPTQAVKTVVNQNRVKTPDSLTKSPFLYYIVDADFYILRFWIENYKKYLAAVIITWERMKDEEPFNNRDESEVNELKVKLLNRDDYMNNLPDKIIEFKRIVSKYVDFETMESKDRDDSFCRQFNQEYTRGITQRNERFIHSQKSVDSFMREETLNKYHGKEHLDVRREQTMRHWYKEGKIEKIEDLLAELEKRKKEPPMEGESRNFYRLAVESHKNIRMRRGKQNRNKTNTKESENRESSILKLKK